MIWPIWIAAAVVSVVVSLRHDPRPAAAILFGLLCVRIIPDQSAALYAIAGAVLWVGIGGLIARKFHFALTGALVVASGLCYFWARVGGHHPVIGALPFVVSDVFGALALLVAARGENVDGGRGRIMDRPFHRRLMGDRVLDRASQAQKGAG